MIVNNIYVILAMKRSGHHAFVNWLCKQHGNIIHIENTAKGWEDEKLESVWNRDYLYGDGSTGTVYSIEDFDIEDWNKYKIYDFPIFKRATNVYPIVFLRDFKNWVASCLKRRETSGDSRDVYEMLDSPGYNDRRELKPSRINLFERQLQECISPSINGLISVKYDEWFASKKYREKIANQLDIKFTDEGLLEVPVAGGGSTFDGMNYDKSADKMEVLNRWKFFEKDPEMLSILDEHKTLKRLSDEYFNL
jgi:hypothetical protein